MTKRGGWMAGIATAVLAFVAGSGAALAADGGGADASPLAIVGEAQLPGYDGDFDHFAADVAGGRLFLAAEDHGTLEVFKLGSLEHLKTVKGPIETPHAILYLPRAHKLLVTDTGKSLSHYFNSDTLAFEKPLTLTQGADSTGYDPTTGHAYIVTGGKDVPMPDSFLEQVDAATGKLVNRAHFDASHVEAMAIESHGTRLFLNVSEQHTLAVLDKRSLKEIARWTIPGPGGNCCIAMDEANHRLFVINRKPGHFFVLDSRSGAVIAQFAAPDRVDQVSWDAQHQRVYVMSGEGVIQIVEQVDPMHYVERPHLVTAPGAKTGVLVPERNELYVAVSPGDSKAMARVLRIATGH